MRFAAGALRALSPRASRAAAAVRPAALPAAALVLAAAAAFTPPPARAEALWGPRFGAGIDPDQFLIGVHVRPGAISRDLYLQPNFQLGLGDDFTIFKFAVPLHYHFPTSTAAKPYAGGGFSLGLVDFDYDGRGPNGEDFDDSEFEASIDLVGGVEWRLSSGNLFMTELLVGLGDLYDLELVVGMLF